MCILSEGMVWDCNDYSDKYIWVKYWLLKGLFWNLCDCNLKLNIYCFRWMSIMSGFFEKINYIKLLILVVNRYFLSKIDS